MGVGVPGRNARHLPRPTNGQQLDDGTVLRTVEALRRRVDALGVTEPTLQRSGEQRLIVELPGLV